MLNTAVKRQAYPDLKLLRFSAKIDFVTLFTSAKLDLPKIDGTAKWPREHHNTRLTVHDPSARDIVVLLHALGPRRLAELEVSVDVTCSPSVPVADRDACLRAVMVEMFARGLDPDGGILIGGFRAFFRAEWQKPAPFNKRLPEATDQLLYGHKTDAVQVKAYYKRTDQRRALPPADWRARVEVALRYEGLLAHGLATLDDLRGFRYRKELSRYFRHVREVSRRELHRASRGPLHRVLLERSQTSLNTEFGRVGMGCAKRGGKFAHQTIKTHQDLAVNGRIGQALLRLERSLSREIRAPAAA